jgi:hypothetical protein
MMRMVFGVSLLLLTLGICGTIAAGDKPGTENKMAVLHRFDGEWEVEGKWTGGQPLQARTVYTWALNKKILRASTFVKDGSTEYQRYEGIMAWHPEKKSLYQISFAFDGSMTEVLIDAKDKDTLLIGYTPFSKAKPSPVRQTIRFLDDDRFQWIVSLQEGDSWKQLIDATWKRKKK